MRSTDSPDEKLIITGFDILKMIAYVLLFCIGWVAMLFVLGMPADDCRMGYLTLLAVKGVAMLVVYGCFEAGDRLSKIN